MGLVVILGDLLANIVLNAAGSKLRDIKNKKDASNYAVNCPHGTTYGYVRVCVHTGSE